MRRTKKFLEFYATSIIFLLLSLVIWRYFPNSTSAIQVSLIGSILGVALSITFAQATLSLTTHLRRKKTFALLKLIAIPHLQNKVGNLLQTMERYNDIGTIGEAYEFWSMSANFDLIAQSFDTQWLKLIYSPDFLDTIKTKKDEHDFNTIATAIKEILLIIDFLVSYSINAKVNVSNDFQQLKESHAREFILRARKARNELSDECLKLEKYINELDDGLMSWLTLNGVMYEECNR